MPTTTGDIVGFVEFDAIVLAGGAASRLGGVDKSALRIEGRTLLQHTLDALARAQRIVVVGGKDPRLDDVAWVVEDPAGGGPAAAVGAGVEALVAGEHADVVVVLACDMPGIAAAVPVLLDALDAAAGEDPPIDTVLAQAGDRTQYLAGAHRTAALLAAVRTASDLQGGSVRGLWSSLGVATVAVPPSSTADIDTWDDAHGQGAAP